MRSQHKFVITASLVCHLFLGAELVTSQARPAPVPQTYTVSGEQTSTREQTPQTQNAATSANQPGNCHLVITSPPPRQLQTGPAGGNNPQKNKTQLPRKLNLAISEEQPVTIDAHECEKEGDVYTLRGAVEIDFTEYKFHGDTVTYDSATGDVTATGHVSIDGGKRDIHISATEATYNLHSQTGKFYNV